MRLHWNRVRRARRLPMPLPPTPRRRPLSPPVLFSIDGYDIRTRRDVDLSFESWDAFLDRVANAGFFLLSSHASNSALVLFHTVARIVPDAERRLLVRDLRCRMTDLCERRYRGKVAIQDRHTREGGLIQRLFRRAA